MKIILVRHGETHWNKQRRVQGGDSDIELNDTGLEQARKLATFLRNEPITAIFSSPLQRAIVTAELIASHHQLPVELDQELRELQVGELEGMPVSNLTTTFSQFLMQWWQGGGTTKLPNGESLVDLQQRAWKAVERLLERFKTSPEHNEGTTVVLVSHYFVTLSIICAALELPVSSIRKMRIRPAGITIINLDNGKATLKVLNDTCHLS